MLESYQHKYNHVSHIVPVEKIYIILIIQAQMTHFWKYKDIVYFQIEKYYNVLIFELSRDKI